MSFEKNRPERVDQKRDDPNVDKFPVEFFGYQKDGYGLDLFIVEYRSVLENFLNEVLLDDNDIEVILEDTTTTLRNSRQTRNWHKTTHYRPLVTAILIAALLKQSSRRKANENGIEGKTNMIDLGAARIIKRLSMVWRDHIISESWEQLRQKESQTGRPYFSVLQHRYEKPWLSNSQLLKDLSSFFSFYRCAPNRQSFRVFLHRAEKHLAKGIVNSVAETIHLPNSNAVQQEMKALDLIHFWERLKKTASETISLKSTLASENASH